MRVQHIHHTPNTLRLLGSCGTKIYETLRKSNILFFVTENYRNADRIEVCPAGKGHYRVTSIKDPKQTKAPSKTSIVDHHAKRQAKSLFSYNKCCYFTNKKGYFYKYYLQ